MKKLIIVLSVLLLTGCFEDSGYITKSCEKVDTNKKTTYTFRFKNDLIDDINVLEEYSGDEITISSIKSSVESQNRYLNLNTEVINNTDTEYTIKYYIDMNNEEILDKFMIQNKRSEFVRNLEDEGYNCR